MDDLISRQAAIEAVMNHYRVGNKPQNEEMDWCAKMLSGLPSAEKGKWNKSYVCNQCGFKSIEASNYCPNCGARMEESE